MKTPIIGIYFLWRHNKVVYVGQSINIPARLEKHKIAGKTWDKATFIACSLDMLDSLEAEFILAHNPCDNIVIPKSMAVIFEKESPPAQPEPIDMSSQPPVERYLKKHEVAEMLCKEPRTIERWMRQGIIPYIKLGNGRRPTVLFRWSDIQAQLESRFGHGNHL